MKCVISVFNACTPKRKRYSAQANSEEEMKLLAVDLSQEYFFKCGGLKYVFHKIYNSGEVLNDIDIAEAEMYASENKLFWYKIEPMESVNYRTWRKLGKIKKYEKGDFEALAIDND